MASDDTQKPEFRNDQWTIIDDLGFESAGDQLAKLILLARPPFAIGVNGKWGSGKTSLMRYAMARLGGLPVESLIAGQGPLREISGELNSEWNKLGDPKEINKFIKNASGKEITANEPSPIRCVWFNTWQYQNDANPMVPLLNEVRNQVNAWLRASETIKKDLRIAAESGLELIGRLTDSALKLIRAPGGFAGLPGTVKRISERIENERFETLTDAQRFNLHFEKAVQLVLNVKESDNPGLNRLVIFIDDLDRCEENKVLLLLEMIKLYLSTKYCVFVLGIDRDAVERAVSRVWKNRSPHEAGEYIEKLFQAIVHVPICGDYSKFVANRLNMDFGEDEKAEKEQVVDLICKLIEPNPRKMKNFINSLMLAWQMAPSNPKPHPGQFVLIHYLRTFMPDIYRLIAYDPENFDSLINAVGKEEEGYDQLTKFLRNCFMHVLTEPGDKDAAVNKLADLRDRHKGDKAFVDDFKVLFNETPGKDIIEALCCSTNLQVEEKTKT